MTDVQQTVSRIRSGHCSICDLIEYLADTRLVVAANAVIALAVHESGEQAIDALLALSLEPRALRKVLGTATLKHLCAAALKRMNTPRSQSALEQVQRTMSLEEQESLEWLVNRLPLSL